MGFAEAIERQAALRQWFGSPRGKATFADAVQQRMGAVDSQEVSGFVGRMQVGLGLGCPFWVGRHIGDLVVAGERSWPDSTVLTFGDLPEPHGFLWFESPLWLPVRDDGQLRPLQALSWTTYAIFDDQEFVPLSTNGDGDEGVHITAYPVQPDGHVGTPIGVYPLRFRHPSAVHEREINAHISARMQLTVRYFQILCGFMRQRVLVSNQRTVTNRSARRRIARVITHEPVVHVVELRRRDYQQREESTDVNVEWSCQWMVRGHWHQYHTKDGLRPRWVAPYVKGDPAKPMKLPQAIAYEVVR